MRGARRQSNGRTLYRNLFYFPLSSAKSQPEEKKRFAPSSSSSAETFFFFFFRSSDGSTKDEGHRVIGGPFSFPADRLLQGGCVAH